MGRGGKREGAGIKKGAILITEKMRFDILHTLRARGFDPLEKILDCYDDAAKLYKMTIDEMPNNHWLINSRWQMKQQVANELLKYIYPQRKAIEVTGANGEDLFQSFADTVRKINEDAKNEDAIEVEAKAVE